MIHDALAWFVVVLCLWGIINPRVPTGIVPTIGLGIIALASLWSVDDWAPLQGVVELLLTGIAVGGVGLMVRFYQRRKALMRRATDWAHTRPPPIPLSAEQQYHVAGGAGRQGDAP